MKEFGEFLKRGIVRKDYPDESRSDDLIREADRKLRSLKRVVEKIGIDNENANDIVEDSYDIILGIVRSKMLIRGLSASGKGAHEAEVAFLGELNFDEREIEFVNKLRYFRNGILYYGKRFDKEYAERVFGFLEKIYVKLNE